MEHITLDDLNKEQLEATRILGHTDSFLDVTEQFFNIDSATSTNDLNPELLTYLHKTNAYSKAYKTKYVYELMVAQNFEKFPVDRLLHYIKTDECFAVIKPPIPADKTKIRKLLLEQLFSHTYDSEEAFNILNTIYNGKLDYKLDYPERYSVLVFALAHIPLDKLTKDENFKNELKAITENEKHIKGLAKIIVKNDDALQQLLNDKKTVFLKSIFQNLSFVSWRIKFNNLADSVYEVEYKPDNSFWNVLDTLSPSKEPKAYLSERTPITCEKIVRSFNQFKALCPKEAGFVASTLDDNTGLDISILSLIVNALRSEKKDGLYPLRKDAIKEIQGIQILDHKVLQAIDELYGLKGLVALVQDQNLRLMDWFNIVDYVSKDHYQNKQINKKGFDYFCGQLHNIIKRVDESKLMENIDLSETRLKSVNINPELYKLKILMGESVKDALISTFETSKLNVMNSIELPELNTCYDNI